MALRRTVLSLSPSLSPSFRSSVSPFFCARSFSGSPLLSSSTLLNTPSPSPFSKSLFRYSSSSSSQNVQEEEEKPEVNIGARVAKASLLLGVTSVIMYKIFSDKRKELKEKRDLEKRMTRSLGLPDIGGPFTMVDDTGKIVTETDFKGKYTLMYFGFTFCPEICPAEMIKISQVYDALTGPASELSEETRGKVLPLFVSVDPWRDSVHQVHNYIKKYHTAFEGLTGTPEQVSRICRTFRVYSSKPDQVEVDSGMDYLVDHSIFIYLMDPNGRLLGYYGQDKMAEEVIEGVTEDIQAFEYRKAL